MQTTTSNDWDLYRFASVTVETGVKGRQMVLGHDRADCAMATGQRLSPVEVTETPWPCACVGVVVDRLPSAVFAAPSEVAGVQYVKPGDRLEVRKGERGHEHVERRLMALGATVRRAGVSGAAWLPEALEQAGAVRMAHGGNHRYAFAIGPARRRRSPVSEGPYPKAVDAA